MVSSCHTGSKWTDWLRVGPWANGELAWLPYQNLVHQRTLCVCACIHTTYTKKSPMCCHHESKSIQKGVHIQHISRSDSSTVTRCSCTWQKLQLTCTSIQKVFLNSTPLHYLSMGCKVVLAPDANLKDSTPCKLLGDTSVVLLYLDV